MGRWPRRALLHVRYFREGDVKDEVAFAHGTILGQKMGILHSGDNDHVVGNEASGSAASAPSQCDGSEVSGKDIEESGKGVDKSTDESSPRHRQVESHASVKTECRHERKATRA